MARSEDAIRRRALKRQRTEEEQRHVDAKAIEQVKDKKRKQQQKQQHQSQDDSNKGQQESKNKPENPLDEIGAWKCPGCGNENFASRNWCNSKTCNEQRPSYVPHPRSLDRERKASSSAFDTESGMKENTWICTSCQYENFIFRDVCNGPSCQQPRPSDIIVTTKERKPPKQQRHDPETSKPLVWSKQADPVTLSKNQMLRQRYIETGGEGMSEEEMQRAKVLIERDERKRLKKLQKNTQKVTEESKDEAVTTKVTSPTDTLPSQTTAILDSKAQMSKNKRLRERFLATGGKNMTPNDIERAKLLLARDERKRNKAATTRTRTTVTNPQHVDQ